MGKYRTLCTRLQSDRTLPSRAFHVPPPRVVRGASGGQAERTAEKGASRRDRATPGLLRSLDVSGGFAASLNRTSPVATASSAPGPQRPDQSVDRGAGGFFRSRAGLRSWPPDAADCRSPDRPECRSRRCGAKGLPTHSASVAHRPRTLGERVPLPALRHRDSRSAHGRPSPPCLVSGLAPLHRTAGSGSRGLPKARGPYSRDNSRAARTRRGRGAG